MATKSGKVLVVGAGIGGIRSALDLAETGHQVILVEKAPHVGGMLSKLDHQFPSNHCGMCKMLPMIERDAASQYCLRKGFYHENIELLTATEVSMVEGEAGNFNLKLRQKTNGVAPDRCVGCGLCESVCPVEVPDEFNGKLSRRKAIYRPLPHAAAGAYILDSHACTGCGACLKVCPTNAIFLSDQARETFNILVVDDELIMRDSLKEWLVTEDFPATEMAASAKEALAKLAEKQFDLMLTDIKMPGMDGVELLQLAQESYPELTVIMMTAYATVETAVAAMKMGARDYFMKPFDPNAMIPLVERIYEESRACHDLERTVQAIIVAGGCNQADPALGVNPYAYGRSPHVVTGLQFERILSNSGATAGALTRPFDGRPIKKIAWMQCVGSRDLSAQADFCSTVCCMYAIKQAALTREKSRGRTDTTIYYMDLRTVGKHFQDYRDRAENALGVKFKRARVHSISMDDGNGDPVLRAVGADGKVQEETVDLVVLSTGQRPCHDTQSLAQALDLELNSWGFLAHEPFFNARTAKAGIFLSGSAGGLKDIRDSALLASAAALEAGHLIRHAGGGLAPVVNSIESSPSLWQEPPRAMVIVCTCGERLAQMMSKKRLTDDISSNPAVAHVGFADALCTESGWADIRTEFEKSACNRLVIGACHPHLFQTHVTRLAQTLRLPDHLITVIHLNLEHLPKEPPQTNTHHHDSARMIIAPLLMGLAALKHADAKQEAGPRVNQRALVIGGGVAGMHAALGIARMGFEVDLVEKGKKLGGNLTWLTRTLEGNNPAELLDDTASKVTKNPLITIYLNTHVTQSTGQAGHFTTQVVTNNSADSKDNDTRTAKVTSLTHGTVVLATGGGEALPNCYGYGTHEDIVTQKELEELIGSHQLDGRKLDSIVMILCAGSRIKQRNYCSRVCCPTALKHALYLKKDHPDRAVYVIYRDMMATGFMESYYTQARRAGVIFIQYDPVKQPQVEKEDNRLKIKAFDPILNAQLRIDADLLVLAGGVLPDVNHQLPEIFGITQDNYWFYEEADPKWRPVDTGREGIFTCGLALAPCTVNEAIQSGQAAAQRALRILTRKQLTSSLVTARVRSALCALCLQCIKACPYDARWVDPETQRIEVNPASCQGCGACAAICPNGAAVLEGAASAQVLEMIDGALV